MYLCYFLYKVPDIVC